MKHLDLFSGIGGFALAARWMGWETVQFVEIDPFCQKVLKKHWPEVPIHDDVTDYKHRQNVDLVTAGFPCPDVSLAGLGAGLSGERTGLFWYILRSIRLVGRPRLLLENVAGLLNRGMGAVLGALASVGYDSEWHCIPASYVGAPHVRDRVWIVADTDSKRLQGFADTGFASQSPEERTQHLAGLLESERRLAVPTGKSGGIHDGISGRTHRLRSLGNAIVPQVAYTLFQAIDDQRKSQQPA